MIPNDKESCANSKNESQVASTISAAQMSRQPQDQEKRPKSFLEVEGVDHAKAVDKLADRMPQVVRKDGKNVVAAFSQLQNCNPRLVKVTTLLLEFFRQRMQIPKRALAGCFPYTYFCNRQIVFIILETLRLFKHQLYSVGDLHDTFSNAVQLHQDTIRQYPQDSQVLAMSITQLLIALGETGSSLELLAGIPVTDWKAIVKTVSEANEQCVNQNRNLDLSPLRFIPRIEHIKQQTLIGAGGFGCVYKATYLPVGLICTVKFVRSEAIKFIDKACLDKVAASVTLNMFVVRLFCSFETDLGYLTLMEYIRGVDLMAVQNVYRCLGISKCAMIMAQMMIAVQHLHYRGIIHRDIKVANTLIMQNGRIKLIDFDIGKICIGHFARRYLPSFYRRTAFEFLDDDSAGTPMYMAPEIFNKDPYGRATDWFSCGVFLYRLFVGRTPFRGNNKEQLAKKIISGKVIFPENKLTKSEKSVPIKEYINRLLIKDPGHRLGSENYLDLLNHAFLKSIDWTKLSTSPENELLFDMKELKTVMVAAPFSPKAKSVPREKQISLQTLSDLPHEEHRALLTYVSPVFRNIQTEGKMIGEHFLSDEERRKFNTIDTLFAFKTAETKDQYEFRRLSSTQGLSRDESESLQILVELKEEFRFETLRTVDERQRGLFLVSFMVGGDASTLVLMDIITEVNGKNTINMPQSDFENIMKNAFQGDIAMFTVLASNPYRMCLNRQDMLSTVIPSVKAFNVTIKATAKPEPAIPPFGMSIAAVKTNDQRKGSGRIHLVKEIIHGYHMLVSNDPNARLFIGDAIIKINDEPTLRMVSIVSLLEDRDTVNLTIAPISALRVNRPSFTRIFETHTPAATPSISSVSLVSSVSSSTSSAAQ